MIERLVYYRPADRSSKAPFTKDGPTVTINQWKPTLMRPIPPLSTPNYIIFYFLNLLRLFKTDYYSAYYVLYFGEVISQVVCVPCCFRWKFMGKEDLQIKNVITKEKYRGKGYADELLKHVLGNSSLANINFWYITSKENVASQKLCQRNNFNFIGYYERLGGSLFGTGNISKSK